MILHIRRLFCGLIFYNISVFRYIGRKHRLFYTFSPSISLYCNLLHVTGTITEYRLMSLVSGHMKHTKKCIKLTILYSRRKHLKYLVEKELLHLFALYGGWLKEVLRKCVLRMIDGMLRLPFLIAICFTNKSMNIAQYMGGTLHILTSCGCIIRV